MDINQIYATTTNLPYHSFYDTIQLPYSFNDIKIQSNEISNYIPLNQSITKLFNNYIYLYGWTKFASTTIPLCSYGIAGNYSNKFSWYTNVSTNQFSLFNTNLDNMGVITPILNGNRINFILGTKNYLNIATSDTNFTTISTTFSTNQTNLNSVFNFYQISSIIYTNNRLYVVDSKNNAVFVYSVQFSPTPSITLLKTINGLGNYQDNSKFNNPVTIDSDNVSFLYVLDAGNVCVKIYDLNLNWISTYNLLQITTKVPISLNYSNGFIYIITSDNSLLKFTLDFNLISITTLNISTSETFKALVFAKTNTNIFYIITDKSIYKCNTFLPGKFIGKFNLTKYNITGDTFVAGSSIAYNNQDYIFCISVNTASNASKIIQFVDTDGFTSNLVEPTFNVYPLSSIQFKPTEYNQYSTYNKNLYFMVLNHYELQRRIKGKFIGTYDSQNNLYLSNVGYILNDFASSVSLNSFIGQNELFTNTTINRCLEQIYNIQLDIANKLKPLIIDSQTSLNIPVVLQ